MKTSNSAPRNDSRLLGITSLTSNGSPKLTLHIPVRSSLFWKVLSVLFLALKICNNVPLAQRKCSQLLWGPHPFLLRLAVPRHGDQCQWPPGRTSRSKERLTFSFLVKSGIHSYGMKPFWLLFLCDPWGKTVTGLCLCLLTCKRGNGQW